MGIISTKISDYIRTYKEKGVSMSSIAKKADISPQCLNGWLKKPDAYWSLDALILLSEVLGFEVSIKNGELKITKGELNMKKEKEMLNKEEAVNYEVYKDFKDYAVVYLYTPTSNLNYDEEVQLLEDDFFIYSSEKECIENHPKSKAVKIYGLLDKETNEICWNRCISIYPYEAENYYYFFKADVIEKTIDGYDVVHIFEDSKLKLVKAYVSDLDDGNAVGGFALMPMDGETSDDFILWGSSVKYLYTNETTLRNNLVNPRYFDRNRDEINVGDILVKKGLPWDADFMQEDIEDDPRMNVKFEKFETIRIKDGQEFYFEGVRHGLNELQLMEWEKISLQK